MNFIEDDVRINLKKVISNYTKKLLDDKFKGI